MRFNRLFALGSFASAALALQLANGVLRTAAGDLQFSQHPQQSVVFDSAASKVDIQFELTPRKIPDQLFIRLSTADGYEVSFKPITKLGEDSTTSKFTLSHKKLPKLFTKASKFDISLIAADLSDATPLLQTIGSVELTPALIQESTYIKAPRFGPKPEIHYIFNSPPKMVNSTIALAFASLSILCLFLLLIAWTAEGAINFTNFPSGGVSHYAFILLIISYEVVFFQYYAGSTIFETIYRVALLTGPTVWVGAKVLNHVGSLRMAGKR